MAIGDDQTPNAQGFARASMAHGGSEIAGDVDDVPAEPVDIAKRLLSRGGALEKATDLLENCDNVFDLEHVDWLLAQCAIGTTLGEKGDANISEVRERFQAAGLKLINHWARGLQANVVGDGAPIDDPLRNELIDSAVTFLEDEQVVSRSVAEKVAFLQEKGLNRTELRIALAQAGVEAPASLQFVDPVRMDQVENGATFLVMPEVKHKTLEERLAFLRAKGLSDGEIVLACEKAGIEHIPTMEELATLKKHKARPAREDMIKNGAEFLQQKSVVGKKLREKLVFLKGKGLVAEEIRQACKRVGVVLTPELKKEFTPDEDLAGSVDEPRATKQQQQQLPLLPPHHASDEQAAEPEENVRSDMVQKGVIFLKHPSVQHKSASEKMSFLRGKGLNESELKKSFQRAGVTNQYKSPNGSNSASGSVANSANVEKAVAFLSHPASEGRSMQEKVQFLRSKGVTLEEVNEACDIVGLSMNNTSTGIRMNNTVAFGRFANVVGTRNNRRRARVELQMNTVSAAGDKKDKGVGEGEGKGMDEMDMKNDEANSAGNGDTSELDDVALAKLRERRKRIEQAKTFLLNAKSQKSSSAEKTQFLLGKGLVVDEVAEAFFKTGLTFDEQEPELKRVLKRAEKKAANASGDNDGEVNDDDMEGEDDAAPDMAVVKAKRFLLDSKTAMFSIQEKVAFLRQQGLSNEQIKAGFELAQLDLNPSILHVSAVDTQNALDKRVALGVAFLEKAQSSGNTRSRIDFLKNKGLSDTEIRLAFERAGFDMDTGDIVSSNEVGRLPMVENGRKFLANPTTQSQPVSAKVAFLKSKGLTDEEVEEAFRLSGIPFDPASLSDDQRRQQDADQGKQPDSSDDMRPKMVEMGRGFLTSPSITAFSTEEKAAFLREKGLGAAEVNKAFKLAGLYEDAVPQQPHDGITPASPLVQQAMQFLLKTESLHGPDKQTGFLKEKGLSDSEIDEAFRRAGVDRHVGGSGDSATAAAAAGGIRTELVEQAIGFLKDSSTQSVNMKERVAFLRNKGLSESEIEHAFELVGISLKQDGGAGSSSSSILLREEFVERGVAFLLDPNVQNVPLEERVEYLQKQGLTEEEVLQAAIRAKVDLVPSYISTVPTATLKRERFHFAEGMDASGRSLQRAINCAVDILLHIEARYIAAEKEVNAARKRPVTERSGAKDDSGQEQGTANAVAPWALTLLATALCRCRAARVVPACVAFSARIIPMALERSVMRFAPDQEPADNADLQRTMQAKGVAFELLEEFLDAHMELVARATQIDIYAKTGLKQQQQVKLHFITAQEILVDVMDLWRQRDAIEFAHGVVLARAVHGQLMRAAATQSMKDASGPVVDCVVEHLRSSRDATQDVAAYVAAGLLRGAPDYAWAKDVKKSPQPRVEAALLHAADVAVRRFEAAELLAGAATGSGEHRRAKGVVTAVGLAAVYCDTQINWDVAVFMAVAEGLLNGALCCDGVLYPENLSNTDNADLNCSLDARVTASNVFTESEIFKLAPQLVSLLLQKLPPPRGIHDSGIGGSDELNSQLCVWVIERLHRFSSRVFTACRKSPTLCGIVCRRTVQLIYGTGKEQQDQKESSPAVEEEGDRDQVDDEDEEDDDEDEEDDDEDEEKDDEDENNQQQLPPSPVDPLTMFLGVHSGIARILQMSYLATVLIGSHCVINTDFDACLLMLDTLANLNAFQVRVQDAVELESLLALMVGMQHDDVKGGDSEVDRTLRGALLLYKLLERHVERQDVAAAIGGDSPHLHDWVLGARVEFLCGIGEPWLLPAFVHVGGEESAVGPGKPAVLANNIRTNFELPDMATKTSANRVLDVFKLHAEQANSSKKRRKPSKQKRRKQHEAEASSLLPLSHAVSRETRQKFSAGMCELLLCIGVPHPFVHLNHRAHRWMTTMVSANIGNEEKNGNESTSNRASSGTAIPDVEPSEEGAPLLQPPTRLACIPRYFSTTLESFPNTPTTTLSFVVASVLTALGLDLDERAQAIAVMAFDNIVQKVDKYMADRAESETNKTDAGPVLCTLMFTALKAISLPALPSALGSTADLIKGSPKADKQANVSYEEEDVLENEQLDALARLKPLTHEWMLENLFGVISRTDDAPRRLLLCQWYLRDVQGLTTGGNL